MRLDKYLKVARILKRRTVSKAASLQGRILVNGKVAKPAHPVKPGDLITLQFGNRLLTVKVLNAATTKPGNDELLYEVVEEVRLNHEEK